MADLCVIEGCDRVVYRLRRNWCRAHYCRWQRHGDPEGGAKNDPLICEEIPGEMWRPFLDGRYAISSYGRLRNQSGRLLRLHANQKGYPTARLWDGKMMKSFRVHRLVAEHFIPNPLRLATVNHLDFNKHNNRIDNLEWCTAEENTAHSVANGRHVGAPRKPKIDRVVGCADAA